MNLETATPVVLPHPALIVDASQVEGQARSDRLLPTGDEKLIVVGGGNMSFGKIQELEVVPVKAPAK